MKTLTTVNLFVAGFVFTTIALGQPPGGRGFEGRRGNGPPNPFLGNAILQALDANGDQVLTAEELENASAVMEKLDRNTTAS